MARLVARRGIGAADLALVRTDAADGIWPRLGFIRLVATGIGNSGAILARRTLLPCRLAGIEGRHREYGLAGSARHQRCVWFIAVSIAHFQCACWRTPLF